MSDLWLPGAGSVDDLVARVQLRIQGFAERSGAPPVVEVELRDGSTMILQSLDAEPGLGFLTLVPHDDGGGEEWIVPVAAVARITLRVAEEQEPFGFTLPEG
ncbi:MAG TPA: hypothetical protein VLD13_11490 [Gaiellaceae bacterium]|nr:hypothetical protein [Gaiellaceae bacterium]